LTAEALEQAITPKTRWLILNTPSNPTGAFYSAAEMKALTEVLKRHPHVALMTDDIYEHIRFDGGEPVCPVAIEPSLAGRTLLINGVSKTYA
ncbi:aminotransferase class I/II-fold pyridoxal phosphate-dependent enzyme, partial [Acinetobacter baumannii]